MTKGEEGDWDYGWVEFSGGTDCKTVQAALVEKFDIGKDGKFADTHAWGGKGYGDWRIASFMAYYDESNPDYDAIDSWSGWQSNPWYTPWQTGGPSIPAATGPGSTKLDPFVPTWGGGYGFVLAFGDVPVNDYGFKAAWQNYDCCGAPGFASPWGGIGGDGDKSEQDCDPGG